jgi:hypothetical protein
MRRDDLKKVGEFKPPVSEFGLVEELLASLLDAIRFGNANFINANRDPKKGKPAAAPKPFPRPETALDRAHDRWRVEDVMTILHKSTPPKKKPS